MKPIPSFDTSEVFIENDQPMECPQCGARTVAIEDARIKKEPNQTLNRCPDCEFLFLSEASDAVGVTAYTVIGLYEDNHQRFAGTYEASSPGEAEEIGRRENPGLIVAAVLSGCVEILS